MTVLIGARGPLHGPRNGVLAASPITSRVVSSKSITLSAVAAQTAGESFVISGTLTGFSTAPTLQYQLNGGTALSFPTPPAISTNLTSYTALMPGQGIGTLSLAVTDTADSVTSNAVVVTVTASNSSGTPGLLPTITIQANTAQGVGAPIAFGHVFAQGDVPAAYVQRLTASAPGGKTMQFQAAQANAWPDGSLRYATLFGRSPVAFAAGQSIAFQLGTGGSAISGAALTPAQVAAGWTQHTFGGDYTSYSYAVTGGTVPASASLTVVSNGALSVSGGGQYPLVLSQPVQGCDQLGMALLPLSGSARTYTAFVQLAASPVPHSNGGLALRNSSTGFITALLMEPDIGTVNVCTYSNATTFIASPGTLTTALNVNALLALRVVWDGSSYTFLASQSGTASSWTSLGTFTAAQIGSPDEIGFYVDNYAVQGGRSETLTVYDWETVSGASPQAGSTAQIVTTSVADTFTVDAAAVVSSLPQYTLTQDAGGHPLGYWELVSQGPLVTEIKVKRYLQRDSDGANHAWDQAILYLRAWSDGQGGILGYHVLPSLRSENVYGANPAGTVGGTSQANRRGITELRLNGGLVKAVGGPNDPSGLATALLQPQCGWFGANPDGSVPWTSSVGVAAPSFMVAHDFTYLFRKTKLLPPYKAPVGTNAAQAYTFTETFIPGAWGSPQFVPYGSQGGYPWPQGLNSTGDDPTDERIGYIHLSGLRCLLNPLDRNTEIRALRHGWLWGEWEIWQTDERSGKPVNCGTTTVGPSAPNPNFATYYNGGKGSPAWMGNINVYTGTNIHDWQNYGSLMDVSHQPSPWIAPLLRTGHAAFQDIAVASACAIAAAYGSGGGNVLFNGVQYDCIWTYFWNAYANDRGAGWGTRITGTCDRMMSDTDPMRPYIQHVMASNVAFAAVGPLNPSQFSESSDFTTKLGLMYMSDNAAANDCGVSSDPIGGEHLFANGIRGLCWGVEAWLNYSPNWARYLNMMAPTLIDTYDDQLQYNGQNGNFGYFLEWYALAGKDTKGNVFQSTAVQVATCGSNSFQIPLPPYPTTGVWNAGIGQPGKAGGTSIGEQSPPVVAGINMQTWLPVPTRSSSRVAAQINTRVNTAPLSGQVFSGVDGWFPTWAIEIAGNG